MRCASQLIAIFVVGLALAATVQPGRAAEESPTIFPQMGHALEVRAVAFSRDGKMLASAGMDKTVILWDVASSRELTVLLGHTGQLQAVAFSPDGRTLVSADADHAILVWEVASGRLLKRLNEHAGAVYAVAFSPDGKTMASAGGDHMIKLWDTASWQVRASWEAHSAEVKALAFAPKGLFLASAGADKAVKLWTLDDPGKGRTLGTHDGSVESLAFSGDGVSLASGGMDWKIKLWSMAGAQPPRTLSGHDSGVVSLSFAPDGTLASGSWDKSIRIWNVALAQTVKSFRDVQVPGLAVTFSRDGRLFAAGGQNNTVRLWQTVGWKELQPLRGRASALNSVALSPDGKQVAVAGKSGAINLWNTRTGELRRLQNPGTPVAGVAFSSDGELLASAANDGTVKIWRPASGIEPFLLASSREVASSVTFSPDGKLLAAGYYSGAIRLWDVGAWRDSSSWREHPALKGHLSPVVALTFSADGKRLASGSWDHHAKLWNLAHPAEPRDFLSPDRVFSVALSADGERLAVGSNDKIIRIWNLPENKQLPEIRSHKGGVTALNFLLDNKTLVSGGWDHLLNLWDETKRDLAVPSFEQTGAINSESLSSNKMLLATCTEDGMTKLWDMPTGRERASFVAFDDGSSLIVTAEGYYATSTLAAEQNLKVRVGDRVFDISAFRDRYYRPDIVKYVLNGGALAGFPTFADEKHAPFIALDSLPPSTTKSTISLTLHITADGGGIGKLRLFRNGTAVREEATIPAGSDDDPVVTLNLPLASGKNVFTASVYDANNSMQTVSIVPAEIVKEGPAKGVFHLVAVGIEDVKKPELRNALHAPFAVEDAKLFSETMAHYAKLQFGAAGYDARALLVSPEDTDKKHIVDVLKGLRSAGPDDTVVIYIAAHGRATGGQFYLITSNVESMDANDLAGAALTGDELGSFFANIPAGKKLVVLDTCDSGRAGEDVLFPSLQQNRGLTTSVAPTIIARDVLITVLSATTTHQDANSGYNGHGLFTSIVVDGLKGVKGKYGAPSPRQPDGTVTNHSIVPYLDNEVPRAAKAYNMATQDPSTAALGPKFTLTVPDEQ